MFDIAKLREGTRIRYPYLASALFRIQIRSTEKIKHCGISKGGVFYYNPETYGNESLVLQVEMFTAHIWIMLKAMGKRKGYRDNAKWNIAVQCEINQTLSLPEDRFIIPDVKGLSAEEYYESISDQDKEKMEGSGIDDDPKPWEDGEFEKDPIQMGLLRDEVARDIRNRSDAPEGAKLWADELINPRISWEANLKNMAGSIIAPKIKSQKTLKRPNKKSMADNIIPGWEGFIPNITILLDTSGSMENFHIKWALGAIKDMAKRMGSVTVLDCDADIHEKRVITSETKEYTGGGGTSMAYGMSKIDKYDCLIVLTDGETDWPHKPMKNVIAITPEGIMVPDWIKHIEINIQDFPK